MKELNPLALDLSKNALIEASAGTGKTYTITTLYLRAILGLHEADGTLHDGLSIDQILVVTFTEAATQELRDRIRTKLKEAQAALLAFLSLNDSNGIDTTLKSLIETYTRLYEQINPEQSQHRAVLSAYHKIQRAIILIDEAAIFTIHGFCQRCLSQFAFETKMAFEQVFEMDNQPFVKQALHDFWRQYAVTLSGVEYHLFKSFWKHPKALYSDIAELLNKQIVFSPALTEEDYQATLTQWQKQAQQLYHDLTSSDFFDVLKNAPFKGNKRLKTQLLQLDNIVNAAGFNPAQFLSTEFELWTSENLANSDNYLKNKTPVTHHLATKLESFIEINERLKNGSVKSLWLDRAKQFIENKSNQIKSELQTLTPDDLLLQLQQAIQGPEEQLSLISAIRSKYPLAFIDEFQDTDPIQYEIFSHIYQEHPALPTANMVMIGDPKQAIYRFRGADIFTYIDAKKALPESEHFTLSTNWRSHPDLIAGVNHFFANTNQPFESEAIPFISVGSGQKDSPELCTKGVALPKIKIKQYMSDANDDKTFGFSLGEIQLDIARDCAVDVAQLLKAGQQGQTVIQSRTSTSVSTTKPLQANDIAILVRNRQQAKLLKTQLNELGVKSVYISRDNVLQTELAKDMLRVFEAIHSPVNERKVKAAVATVFFKYDLTGLATIMADGKLWHRHLLVFHQAHELWSKGKIAAALNVVIEFAESYLHWQQQSSQFERLVTDVRHILELIQQEALVQSGAEKLLAWFSASVLNEISQESDVTSMRLESDSNLVQIVTMHGSKGLEYPVVFIPFTTEFKAQKRALYHSDGHQGLCLRVDNRKQELQMAEQERLAEDIRLLYVAMTRAKQHLVMGCFNLKEKSNSGASSVHKSAFGRLILGKEIEQPSESVWLNSLKGYFGSVPSHQISLELVEYGQPNERFIQAQLNPLVNNTEELNSFSYQRFNGEINQHWQVLSYSGLVGSHEVFIPGATDEGSVMPVSDHVEPTALSVDDSTIAELNSAEYYRFEFPKGANAGSCLHHMLENLDFQLPLARQSDVIENALALYGLSEVSVELTSNWIEQILKTKINNWSLSELNAQARLDEMEFYFNVKHLNQSIISDALLMCGFNNQQLNLAVLTQDKLQGLIKGFIDLLAVYEDQYYVIDYKSNYLGDSFEDYQNEKLLGAMTDHNYHLQLIIYSYALHKWLSLKLPDYDYNRDIAGGAYLFLRGMSPKQGTSGVYQYKVPFEVIQYMDNALQGEGK